MSIYAAPGTSFEATSSNVTTGLTGTIGVRIMDGQGNTSLARATTNIVESPAGSGIYTATITAPETAGTYNVVWDTGGGSPRWAVEELNITSSAPATVSPSGEDLTTLAAVRRFLQKNDATNTTQDTVIQELISRASDQINQTIAFFPAQTAASKTFVWRGGPLSLWPYFLGTVTSVTLDTETSYTTTATSDNYRLRPKPAREGVYRWLTFPSYSVTPGLEREITIVGDWGFTTIPDRVEHWAIVTVATWLRRDVSAFSTTLRLDEDRLERPDALPSAVVRGLSRYAAPNGI